MTYHQEKKLNNFEIVLSEKAIWKVQIYDRYTVDNILVYILYDMGRKS